MPLSSEDIKKLGQLARLKLTDKEIAQYRTELGGILRYVDQLRTARIPKAANNKVVATPWRDDAVITWPDDERLAALEQAEELNEQVKVKRILA